jgi:hypothetical protein
VGEPDELRKVNKPIVIGSDPSGFAYLEDAQGPVWGLDTDGRELTVLATILTTSWAESYSSKKQKHLLEEWIRAPRKAGLVT